MFSATTSYSTFKGLEEAITSAETSVSATLIKKAKADFDADLRREHPSMQAKLNYGHILVFSPSRGQTRTGIDVLSELQSSLEREMNLKGASHHVESHVTRSDFAIKANEDGEEEPGYVFLNNQDVVQESVDVDKGVEVGQAEPAGTAEGQNTGAELDEEEESKEDTEEDDDEKMERPLVKDVVPPFPCPAKELLSQCIFYKALGYYRLSDYRRAMKVCDELAVLNTNITSGSQLRSLCLYSMVSRGALGFLVTIGVAVPAAYLYKSGRLFAA